MIGLRFRVPIESDENNENSHESNSNVKSSIFKDHTILNPGPVYVIPSASLVTEMVFVSQSMEDLADIESLTPGQFELTWNKWITSSSEELFNNMNAGRLVISEMFNPQELSPKESIQLSTIGNKHSGNCKCVNLATRIATSDVTPGLQEPSKAFSTMGQETEFKEATNTVDDTAPRDTRISRPKVYRSLDVLIEEEGDNVECEHQEFLQESPEISNQNKSSKKWPGDYIYIGHPAPPHHLVLDQDLQVHYCFLLS
jgi:hypothetical protein